MQENIDYITCKICGKKFKRLGQHLISHGVTKQQYKKQFPNAKTICDKTRLKISNSATKYNKNIKTLKTLDNYKKRFVNKKENIDYVVCQICGKKFIQLSTHLIVKHNMNAKMYKKIYKNAPTISLKVLEKSRKVHLNPKNKKIYKMGYKHICDYNGGYDPKWNNNLRQKIREKYNYTCQFCGKKIEKHLIVHHIDYDKRNSNEDNLIPLCRSCHGKVHTNRTKYLDNITFLCGWKFYFQELKLSASINKTQKYLKF